MFFHIEQEKNIVLEPMYFGKRMREMIESRVRQEVRVSRTLDAAFESRDAARSRHPSNPKFQSVPSHDRSNAPPSLPLSQVEGSCTGRHGYIVMVTNIVHISEGMITDDGTARAKFHVKYSAIAFRPFKNEVLDCVVVQVTKFGFFAEAGPLSLFVSNQLIEDDMTFESVDENAYVSADGEVRIQKNAEVRVRVVGMRIDASEIFCIATIKEDYLGVIGKAEEGEGVEEDA
jgi:DNA-directed RNA polymerase II subunit RPB7